MELEGKVGPQTLSDGSKNTIRTGKTGEAMTSDVHARFQEAALRGNLYSGGMTTTSISNATFTTATLDATATPIIGLWNPTGSGKNLVVIQAKLQCVITNATATGGGAFMWCTSLLNGAISTGIAPLNRFTLAATGSVGKVYANTALTGLTTSLSIREASALQGGTNGNYSMVGTAVGFSVSGSSATIDNIDGSIIIPPGGVLALLCTTTPVAISAASSILWEEIIL